METEYAIYRGDTFLFIDTLEKCAERLGIKTESVKWMASPAGRRRFESRSDILKAMTAIKLEEEVK